MKKWCLMVAAMLCLMIPTVGSAQGLPDFLQAVQSGLQREGLSAGSAAMEKDLALSMTLSDSRVEEGRDVTLTIRAENPRPAETGVSLTLNLPERLAAQTGDELTWNAVLPGCSGWTKRARLCRPRRRRGYARPDADARRRERAGNGDGGNERRFAFLPRKPADCAVCSGYFRPERSYRARRTDGRWLARR